MSVQQCITVLHSKPSIAWTTLLCPNKFFAILTSCHAYLRFRYPIRTVDGHGVLPTLPFVFPNGQGNIEKYLRGRENSMQWGATYGHIYRIWSGFHGEIVLTKPNDIEIVFRDSHKHLKANANDSGHYMYQLLGICLGLVSGADWRSLRKATEAPFTRPATDTYVQTVIDHATEHIQSLHGDKPEQWNLRPHSDLRIYPFLALADIIYGKLTPKLKTDLLQIVPGRDSVFAHMMMGGVTRYRWATLLPLKPNREMRTFKRVWSRWNDDAYVEALRQVKGGRRPAPIVQMYASVADGSISREGLLQTMDEMLFANLDVSIGALAWALIFIAASPQTQARLLSEVNSAYHEKGNRDAYLLSQSSYLHHTILEAGRLRPVAAFSVAQACPTERQLGPYLLPAGSKFVVDAHALNIRDPLWSPDNTSFRPERWSDAGVKRTRDVRYCYWRFGFGPRVCLGKYVAIIVETIRGWQIKLEHATGEDWKWDPDTWTLPPDLRILCKRRGSEAS
ncbi:cytochrome P450 [Paraphoma chrysanthemicola]|uniref:Cytochrome P450 n=1 Tax=Paraphoma chrysanthemicola TaxID=798071 RepID=A0A8K0QVA3_9PLEO|nr:cytochrome P450 [Paraphoma chrysanthemicola]